MKVTDYQLDALKEHLNIGVGDAASDLSQMVETEIFLDVPSIKLVPFEQIKEIDLTKDKASAVMMPFDGKVAGNASVVFSPDSALRLINLLIRDSNTIDDELDELKESTLLEVGNIIINAIMSSLSNAFHMELEYQPPIYKESTIKEFFGQNEKDTAADTVVVFGETFFLVESEQITGNIYLAFVLDDLEYLLRKWQEE